MRKPESALAPLSGIRVLDLSRILSGPYATMVLADLGAEVIKVESPSHPDDTRSWGPPFVGGQSTYFLSINRSKLGVTLDFKKPRGLRLLEGLLENADVLVENFRPGALEKVGMDFDQIQERFPRLVYCSISGYGHSGPRRPEPGYDVVIQGESGVMSLTGDAAGPGFKMGVSIADITCGLYAVQGILAALYCRKSTGRGQKIDVSLLDCMVSTLTYQAGIYFAEERSPIRMGNRHPSIVPYETFEAADGVFNLGIANEKQWKLFCEVIDRPDLKDDPRFVDIPSRVRNHGALLDQLAPIFRTAPLAHWLQLFRSSKLPCGEVRTVAQALEEPQLRERGMILELEHPVAGRIRTIGSPIKLSDAAPSKTAAPPLAGQHNEEVYGRVLGLKREEIESLKQEGVI